MTWAADGVAYYQFAVANTAADIARNLNKTENLLLAGLDLFRLVMQQMVQLVAGRSYVMAQ